MRVTFFISLIAALFMTGSYWYVSTASICPAPITYTIGDIDSRFGITADEIKVVLAEAEAIWEGPTGRELFNYDNESTFKINFIYDERQQLTRTEEEWRVRLDTQEAEQAALTARLKKLSSSYSSKESVYQKKRTTYETGLAAYNAEVDRYNKAGGAPQEAYEALKVKAATLNLQLKELGDLENGLNTLADTINQLGDEGNQNVVDYNAEVVEYNEIFGNRETFTQGDYERKRINIYKFSDKNELIKVIAHEFGHSLGIGHVESESSIMYYLLTDRDSSSLSELDMDALVAVCGEETTTAQTIRHIIRTILKDLNI